MPSGLSHFFGHFFQPPGPADHFQVIVPENVQSGKTFSIVVEAEDASNHLATGYTGTVNLTLSSTSTPAITGTGASSFGAALTALPLSYQFSAKDHGIHVFQINLTNPGTAAAAATLTATDSTTGATPITGQATTTVNLPPTLAQLVVVTPEQAVVGVATRVTVEALDSSGHLLRNFSGTVTLGTSDGGASGLPSTYTFQASDHGKHTFQVTFSTVDAGSPTTVTATDGAITDTADVTVDSATQVTHFGVFVFPVAKAGAATTVKVEALNAANQVVTGYTGLISLVNSDTAATGLPSTYQFLNTDNGVKTFTVTFNSPGAQTITASDSTLNVSSTADVYVVSFPTRHHWWLW